MARTLVFGGLLVLLASLAAEADVIAVEPGIYRVGFDDVDELLGLSESNDVLLPQERAVGIDGGVWGQAVVATPAASSPARTRVHGVVVFAVRSVITSSVPSAS
jgi:hypothetical protein